MYSGNFGIIFLLILMLNNLYFDLICLLFRKLTNDWSHRHLNNITTGTNSISIHSSNTDVISVPFFYVGEFKLIASGSRNWVEFVD